MGFIKEPRPVRSPFYRAFSSGIETTGASTILKTVTCSSALAVAASATITKTVTCSSGATVAAAATLSNALIHPVEALTSTDTGAMTAYGITTLTSSSAATAFTLPAPVAGQFKAVFCIKGTGTNTAVASFSGATGSTGFHFATTDADNDLRKATFNASNEGLLLYGVSALEWFITSNINSVTIAAT